jgi:hypothetical protein
MEFQIQGQTFNLPELKQQGLRDEQSFSWRSPTCDEKLAPKWVWSPPILLLDVAMFVDHRRWFCLHLI